MFINSVPATRENLLKFSIKIYDLWQGLYASLYLPGDKTLDASIRKKALALRKKMEKLEYELFNFTETALHRIYPSLGVLAKYISWEELASGHIPGKRELKRRSESLIVSGDKIISPENLRAQQRKFKFVLESAFSTKGILKLKGQPAFSGKIKGRVRKILKVSDVPLLKKNEVLVSYMTIPDFLPAMKKASAFITDEGGMLCHAAIVAREMKKPCIIGTKFSTQVLKDGDMVEVDAVKGIVKILR